MRQQGRKAGLDFSKPLKVSDPQEFAKCVAAMAVAGLNAIAFHVITAATMAEWDSRPRLPPAAQFAGAIGLILWTNVILAGRLMYYANTWFRP